MLTRWPHELTIGLADELCQRLPRLPRLLLEAWRIGTGGLEQKLLTTLGVDLAEQLVDPLPVPGALVPSAHAASRSSAVSTSAALARAGRRKTPVTTNAAASIPPRTINAVWKPLTVAAALAAETP
jgi:hypothetical protein